MRRTYKARAFAGGVIMFVVFMSAVLALVDMVL